MDFLTFAQQLVNGLSLGSMYALIAIGYTMVYGVLRLINFAHADIMMVGAFFIFFGVGHLGLPFWAAAMLAIALSALVGLLIDRVAYQPLRTAPRISVLITAIGMSFFLENLFNVVFGSVPQAFYIPPFFEQTFHFHGLIISILSLIIPVVTLLLLWAVLYVLYQTKQGMAIRAVSLDVQTVRLMGINANGTIRLVFIMGSSLAAIGGMFFALSYPTIDPLMGVLVGLKAFAAAVLGGIGSVTGAMLGGFIIGFTEVIVIAIIPELGGYKDAFAFLFLILILLFRPTGIMGEKLGQGRF